MTDRELFVKEQERAWGEHRAFVREYDARCEQDRQRSIRIDQQIERLGERIDKLISGIGEFMRAPK